MAQVYRTIGSLSRVLNELRGGNVTFLNSLDDIISFDRDFDNRLHQIKEQTVKVVLDEKDALKQKLADMSAEYDTKIIERQAILTKERVELEALQNQDCPNTRNILFRLYNTYERFRRQKKLNKLSTNLESETKRPFNRLEDTVSSTRHELQYMEENIDKVVGNRVQLKANSLQTARAILQQNKAELLGAIGEHRAVTELKKLPDSFSVINDFRYQFGRPLHRRETDEWIRSIQVDHIVVGPSGVFIIETKNWGSSSIQSIDLYSPVEQVKRTSYAVFLLLNQAVSQNRLPAVNHHWGLRKISVNNIVLMINRTPNQEFQYVKILSLGNLCSHITRHEPKLTGEDVRQITEFLLASS